MTTFDLAAVLKRLGDGTTDLLAARLDVHPRTVQKWAEDGIDLWQADRVATALSADHEVLFPGWEAAADEACREAQWSLFDAEAM